MPVQDHRIAGTSQCRSVRVQEHLIAGASDGRNITHQADALEPMTRIGEQDVHDRSRTCARAELHPLACHQRQHLGVGVLYICMYIHTCTACLLVVAGILCTTSLSLYIILCIYSYSYTYLYIYIHLYIHLYILHMYIHTHTYINTYMHTYVMI